MEAMARNHPDLNPNVNVNKTSAMASNLQRLINVMHKYMCEPCLKYISKCKIEST